MNKVKQLFLAAALMSSLFLSSCNHDPANSTDDGKEQVYVLPTKLGKRYLRGADTKGVNPGIDVRKDDTDNSYHMVIDASAVGGESVTFNSTGTGYTDNDIDVRLFGIGTNLHNTSNADTLLYATLEADDMAIDDSSTTSTETQTTETNIVTGVEYAYGSGPIKKEFDREQLLWLKTTVMEEKDGAYVANPTTDIKFTPVYIELKDTVAPILTDFTYDVSYSEYVEASKHDIATSLRECINDNFSYMESGEINKYEKPQISKVNFDNSLSGLHAGDTITGTFTVVDSSGNVSEAKTLAINITKDFDVDTVIELPYSETIKEGQQETMDYLKEKIANTIYHGARLTPEDIAIEGEDSLFNNDLSMTKLTENITQEKIITVPVSLASKGYEYSKDSAYFPVKVKIIDDVSKVKYNVNYAKGWIGIDQCDSIDAWLKGNKDYYTIIDEDFSDTYYIYTLIYYRDELDKYEISFGLMDTARKNLVSSGKDFYTFLDNENCVLCGYTNENTATSGCQKEVVSCGKKKYFVASVYSLDFQKIKDFTRKMS